MEHTNPETPAANPLSALNESLKQYDRLVLLAISALLALSGLDINIFDDS